MVIIFSINRLVVWFIVLENGNVTTMKPKSENFNIFYFENGSPTYRCTSKDFVVGKALSPVLEI